MANIFNIMKVEGKKEKVFKIWGSKRILVLEIDEVF